MSFEDKESLRSINGEYKDSFWVICKEDGVVSLCSGIASEHGITAGMTSVSELINEKDHAVLADGISIGCKGGEVSLTVTAASHTGFDTVQIKSVRLFSAFGAELRFYKSKEEYLAASNLFGERLGRVFDYIGTFTAEIGKAAAELYGIADMPPLMEDKLRRIAMLNGKMIGDSRYLFSEFAEDGITEDKICDMAMVFNAVGKCFEGEDGLPFDAAFVNHTEDYGVICATQPKRFAGIILTAVTVAARLSDRKMCTATLTGDKFRAVLEVGCRLHKDHKLCGRSEDLDSLYRCIPANPIELIMLERLTYVPEWKTEYSADGEGNFVLRAVLDAEPHPDTFKYRDVTATVPDAFRQYSDYIKASFSSDA